MTTAIIKATDIDLDSLQRMAKMMVASGYFDVDRDVQKGIAQMAIKIMAGRELGYGPFASVQGIHVIKGKPSLSANLMAAAVKNHPRYDYRVRKMSAEAVAVEFFEDGQSIGMSEFTAQDAKDAGLTNSDMYKKFSRNMLFARAISNGVRFYCPDVFSGSAVYVPEELGGETDGNGIVVVDSSTGEIIEPTPAKNGNGKHVSATAEAEPDFPSVDPPPSATNVHQPKAGIITEAQRNTLHALGVALYGDKDTWDSKRPGLVSAISKKRTESSSELWQAQAVQLISKLESKVREAYGDLADELTAGVVSLDPNLLVEIDNLNGVELANSYKALRGMPASPLTLRNSDADSEQRPPESLDELEAIPF